MNKIIAPRSAMTLGTLALLGFASTAVSAQLVTSYSGDAYIVRSDEFGTVVFDGDTGSLPPAGGSLTASLSNFTDRYVATRIVNGTASASGGSGVADSSTTVTGFRFDDSSGDTVSFDSETVLSHADASGVTGSVVFTNLVVNGTSYPSSVAPNTVISLNVGRTITLNEQTNLSVAGHNEITVQGVDLLSPAVFELNTGVANSDVTFPQNGAVPEPGSIALLVGMTTVGAGVLRRRRK